MNRFMFAFLVSAAALVAQPSQWPDVVFDGGGAKADQDCAKWVRLIGGRYRLVSAGAACGSGGGGLPDQAGNNGEFLTTNGTVASWVALSAGNILSGIFADALISQSSVTQHQTALVLGTAQIAAGIFPLVRGGTNQATWIANRCVQVNSAGTALESAGDACGSGGALPSQSGNAGKSLVTDGTTASWAMRLRTVGGSGCLSVNLAGDAVDIVPECIQTLIPPSFDRYIVAAKCQNTVAGPAFSLDSSNAPTASCQVGANTPAYATLDWDDTGTKTAYDFLVLPSTLPGTIKVDIGVSTSTTSTSDVSMRVASACVASGASPDPVYNTAQVINVTPSGTVGNPVTATLSSLTLTGCAANRIMRFKIDRDTADANTAVANVHFVRFYQ